MALTPQERSLRASLAAHARWAKHDSREHAKKMRAGYVQRFYDEVDPHRELPDDERERRAQHAMQAHMKRLSLKAAKAKRRKADEAA